MTGPAPRRRGGPPPSPLPQDTAALPPRRRSTFATAAPQPEKPGWLRSIEAFALGEAWRWEDAAGVSRAWWWVVASDPKDGGPGGTASVFIREFPMRSLQFEVDVAALLPPEWDKVPVGGFVPPPEVPKAGELPPEMSPCAHGVPGVVPTVPERRATRPVARFWIHGVEPLRLTLQTFRPWEWAVQAWQWETKRTYYPR